jgi:hypothetical protein
MTELDERLSSAAPPHGGALASVHVASFCISPVFEM